MPVHGARSPKWTLFTHASALNTKCSYDKEIGDKFVVGASTGLRESKYSVHCENLFRLVPVLGHGVRVLSGGGGGGTQRMFG